MFLIKPQYQTPFCCCENEKCDLNETYDGDISVLSMKYEDYCPYENKFSCPECNKIIYMNQNDWYDVLSEYTDSILRVQEYIDSADDDCGDILEIPNAVFELNMDALDVEAWSSVLDERGAPFVKTIYPHNNNNFQSIGKISYNGKYSDVLEFSPLYWFYQYSLWTPGQVWMNDKNNWNRIIKAGGK